MYTITFGYAKHQVQTQSKSAARALIDALIFKGWKNIRVTDPDGQPMNHGSV